MATFEFPASFAQRRMWLLDQLDPGRPTYVIGWAAWLDGPLDTDALGRAWAAAVARHEALRTTVRDSGGTPTQVIDSDGGPAPLVAEPVEHLSEAAVLELVRDHARVPFDLDRAPLLRIRLLRLGPQRHVLSVVAHHIVTDGWSFRLLFAEVAADYAALRDGTGPVTPEPPVQYADYTQWQFEHADADGYAASEAYWQAELAGAPTEVDLPADRPYPPRQGYAAAEIDFPVDAATAAGLRRLATERGTTLFAVVAAAYAALLHRFGAADDLLVCVPVAARTRFETGPVVGLFANTLAIRADLSGNPTLGDLVDRLHATTARALVHQELPFARVVEVLRPDRSQARAALTQVMCAVEEAWPAPVGGGLRWRPQLLHNGTGKFELELTLTDVPDDLRGRLSYLTGLFTPTTAHRLVAGLHRILAALATDPGTRVSDVDLLDTATRDLVTRAWPGPDPLGPPPTAAGLAFAACAEDGDRAVIADATVTFTAAGLRATAGRIAAGLRGHGVRAGDTVAILLPRSAWTLPALLGAWWAGAAYLPLDPNQPAERLRGMLADAGARVLVTHGPPPAGLTVAAGLDLSTLAAAAAAGAGPEPADPPPSAAVHVPPPSAAAYVLFTSGSTGRPKAVTVTQGGLGRFLAALRDLLPIGPGDRMAALATFGFDIAVVELLVPLLRGASVTVIDDDTAIDGARLRRQLDRAAVTVVQATPTTWRMLVAAGGVPDGVRLRLSGGEALPRDLADHLRSGPGAVLWNLYGPTETTVYSTGGVVDTDGRLDIGTALAGNRVYVLDRWLRPVPPGVVGEIVLGGECLAHGYPAAPGLTADRFVPDPFGAAPGGRLYRSGDLGRWRPDGRLEPLGRVDRQVKIRGFRVEAGEIEGVLRGHPDVTDAVVTAVPGPTGETRLAAYVVPRVPAGLDAYLRRFLPGYMVPAAVVDLPELPRTGRGKIDHRALPEPRWGAGPGAPAAAPRTPLERELAELVGELLGLGGPVGVDDNFFVLGGHSFTATQVMARIWSRYGVDLPVRALFDRPTVADLAATVAAAGAGLRPADDPFSDDEVDDLFASLAGDDRAGER